MRKNYKLYSVIAVIGLLIPTISAQSLTTGRVDLGKNIVLSMKYTGGFVMEQYARQRMAEVVVYKNRTVIRSDRNYSGNYRNYRTYQLSKSEFDSLINTVKWASSVKDWGMPGVSDMVSTELTLALGNEKPLVVSVYALELAVEDTGDFYNGGLSKENKNDRSKLQKGLEVLNKENKKNYTPVYVEAWEQGYRAEAPGGGYGLANPASTFCIENGGDLVNKVDSNGGEYSNCLIGGKEIEEWAYYRDNLSKASKKLGKVNFINGCAKVSYSLIKKDLTIDDSASGGKYFSLPNGRLDRVNFYPVLPGFTACQR